jgi:hypothetical protein
MDGLQCFASVRVLPNMNADWHAYVRFEASTHPHTYTCSNRPYETLVLRRLTPRQLFFAARGRAPLPVRSACLLRPITPLCHQAGWSLLCCWGGGNRPGLLRHPLRVLYKHNANHALYIDMEHICTYICTSYIYICIYIYKQQALPQPLDWMLDALALRPGPQ